MSAAKDRSLNAEKNRFIGMAAHDLRTPLSVIPDFSQFLRSEAGGRLKPEELHFVDVIHQTSHFLVRMVSDLLDVSGLESGRLSLNLEPADLRPLVERAVELHAPLASAKSLSLELHPSEGLPSVFCDSDRIGQVLNNLLGNAIKFSNPGGAIRVALKLRNGAVEVSVQDAGVGIPEEFLAHLVRGLSGVGQRGTAGEECTGLGLAIARRIVEVHSGSLTAESQIEHGSTFRFTLPLAEATSCPPFS